MLSDEAKKKLAVKKEDFIKKVDETYEQYLNDLLYICKLKTVALQKDSYEDFKMLQDFVIKRLKKAGFDDARVVYSQSVIDMYNANKDSVCPPRGTILAKRVVDPDLPTVMLYAHYDVQPAPDKSLWKSEPFEPTFIDGRLYGRGTSDDKISVITQLAVVELLKDELPVNVCIFFEGEEEEGSATAIEILKDPEYIDYINPDLALIVDVEIKEDHKMAFEMTLRGVLDVKVTVTIGDRLLHCGEFGGPIPEPNMIMAKIISSLYDENGDCAVDGLYEYKVSEELRDDLYYEYPTDEKFKKVAQLKDSLRLIGTGKIDERIRYKPTCTVIGYDLPGTEDASGTIYPSVSAMINFRCAPDQDPEEALAFIKKHIESVDTYGAEIDIMPVGGLGAGAVADLTTPMAGHVFQAFKEASGKDVLISGCGGSIGVVTQSEESFKNSTVIPCGCTSYNSNQHAENENIDAEDLRNGIMREMYVLEYIGALARENKLS